ncbi:MAG: rhomboid family intramembrane serine protease [Bacteroidota bacterium]|jgi:membrane associated rhomboid family serine protease
MRNLIRDIRTSFGASTALFQLMSINVAVFLILTLSRTVLFLSSTGLPWIDNAILWLSLPASPVAFLRQPWSLVSYMFLHRDFFHLLFNMLLLFWMGKLYTEYLGNRRLWGTYLLGGLCGGVFYFLAFNLLPAFGNDIGHLYLLGASASVIAVMVAIATLLPDYTVHLLLIGPVRLKFVALTAVLLYFISIPLGNSGGHIAHLGGAFAGWISVIQLRRGRDLTSFMRTLESLGAGRRKLKVVSRSNFSSEERYRQDSIASQELVDRILDKINKTGFDSLTKAEKEILYRASGKGN